MSKLAFNILMRCLSQHRPKCFYFIRIYFDHSSKAKKLAVELKVHDRFCSQYQVHTRLKSEFIQTKVPQKCLLAKINYQIDFFEGKYFDGEWGSLNAMVVQVLLEHLKSGIGL